MAGYAAGNIVDFIRGFGERKRQGAVREELKNYLTKPEETITAVTAIDAPTGIALNQQRVKEQATALEAKNAAATRNVENFGKVRGFLRGLPAGSDYGAAFDQTAPFLKSQMGMDDGAIAQARAMIVANPGVLLDDEAYKASLDSKVIGPGGALTIGGKVAHQQPFAPQVKTVNNGQGGSAVVVVDPNSEQPGAGAQIAPPAGADYFRGGIIPAEGGTNPDGSFRTSPKGAVGPAQVMPGTAPEAAQLAGLAFDPVKYRTDPEYNLALGEAYFNKQMSDFGDPALAAAAYNAGPTAVRRAVERGGENWLKYLPRETQQYVPKVLASAGGATGGARTVANFPGKPSVRAATQQELAAAGYPTGAAGQIDERTGKFTNLVMPPAAKGAKVKDPALLRERAMDTRTNMIRMRDEAIRLRDSKARAGATGSIQGRLPSIFQSSVDFDNAVQGLKSNIGLNVMESMKALSATGATGFGNMSNAEGTRIESKFGNLNQSGDETFGRTLNEIISFANEKIKSIDAGLGALPPAVGTQRRNPKTGAVVEFNGQGWVPVRK